MAALCHGSHHRNPSLLCLKTIRFGTIPWYSLPPETPPLSSSLQHRDPFLLTLSEAIRDTATNSKPLKRLLPSLKPDHILDLITTNPLSLSPTAILTFFNSISAHVTTLRLTIHTYCAMAHFLVSHNLFSQAEFHLRFLVNRKGRDSASSIFNALLETNDIHHHHRQTRPNFLYQTLMTVYLQSGLISDSIQCFRLMKKHRIQFPFQPCVRLFHHLVKTRSTETALGFYKELLEGGFPPNVICFNILTHKFCKDGKIKEAQSVFDLIAKWGLRPSVVSYNTLICGYCKTLRDLDEGFRLKNLMEERKTTPDVYTYSVLITGLCKEGRLQDANSLFDEMCKRGLAPNNVIYTSLIDGCCKHGRIDSGMEIYRQMLRKGVRPDLVTCNTLLYGLCKGGNIGKAQKLLDEMGEKGVRPDKFSYTTVIDGCCKEGDIDTALELRKKMDEQGIPLDEVTFTAIISGLCRAGRVSEAERTLKEMVNGDIKPDLVTYTMVIDGFCKKGDVKAGFKLLKEMREKGHVANVVTYNVLMNGLCKQGQMKNAGVLLDAMINVGVVPDDITYNILLDGHCRNGNGSREDLKRWREEKGLIQDYASYSLLVNDLSRRW